MSEPAEGTAASRGTSFLAELRRRNVIRMAGLYLVGAWLVVQVSSTVLPMFGAPDWLPRSIVIALAVGFVPALVFAWVFELTPEGLKRDAGATETTSPIGVQTARRMDRAIIAILVLALGYFGIDKFVLAPRREAALVASTKQDAAKASRVDASNERSIAVLPFENLSADKDNAYFADGMQDEILTRLAKIGALKVISRTSTAHYASRPDNLPQIARQLGVANILEGSVQKAGNTVRINVQLIRAGDDSHLWAETYDRKLDDVFGMESEVAGAIADALGAQLSGAEKSELARAPTRNVAAYEAYLRGRVLETQTAVQNGDSLRRVAGVYEEAVRLDPQFALAWARLSIVRGALRFVDDFSPGQIGPIKQAADNAMRLQPELGESWLALAIYQYRGLLHYEDALATLEQARRRLPNSAEVFHAMGWIERRLDRWPEGIAHLQRATQLEPRDVDALTDLAGTYDQIGDFAAELATYDRARALQPDEPAWQARRASAYQNAGDLASAARLLRDLPLNPGTSDAQISQLVSQRHYPEALAIVAQMRAQPQAYGGPAGASLYEAMTRQVMGDEAGARASFQRLLPELATQDHHAAPESLGGGTVPYAYAYAALGDKARALELLRRGEASFGKDAVMRRYFLNARQIVMLLAGDRAGALDAVEQAATLPGALSPGSLRFDPLFDPLRSDPRFQAVLEKVPVVKLTPP